MKKNCYINKKSSGLMVGLVLLSSTLSFAAQEGEAAFDQARYAAIEKLYLAGNLNKASIDDIKVVQQHRNALVDEKAKVAALYAPGIFNAAGKGFAAIALAGGLASAIGAIAASHILGRPENKGEALVSIPDKSKMEWKVIPGATYLERLKINSGYFNSGYFNSEYFKDSYSIGQSVLADMYLNSLPTGEWFLGQLGLFAPSAILGSLVLAGLSRYLLNKSASYTSEIERLQAEIKLDDAIITELKAVHT